MENNVTVHGSELEDEGHQSLKRGIRHSKNITCTIPRPICQQATVLPRLEVGCTKNYSSLGSDAQRCMNPVMGLRLDENSTLTTSQS